MKYFTMNRNESLKDFLYRALYTHRGEYYIKHISPVMGRGIQVIELTNEVDAIKLEVEVQYIDDIKDRFPALKLKTTKRFAPKSELGNIEDLYK